MWEDVFQVYERVGDRFVQLIASDMNLDNAVLFVKAWMEANYRDEVTSLDIRRQAINRSDENEMKTRRRTAMENEVIKLKPCPFCGGEAETDNKLDVEPIIDQNGAYVDANTYCYEWTGCPKCNIWFNLGEDEPEGTTVEKWNRRAKDAE